jgi:hypothetical protein
MHRHFMIVYHRYYGHIANKYIICRVCYAQFSFEADFHIYAYEALSFQGLSRPSNLRTTAMYFSMTATRYLVGMARARLNDWPTLRV